MKLAVRKDQPLRTKNGSELNVTWINPTTKKAESVIHIYEYTKKGDSIFKAYKHPSNGKIDAFNDILKEMSDVGGFNMRITGAGSDVFSCAYQVKDGSNITYLVYHTPSNRFAVEYRVPVGSTADIL